MSVSGNIGDIFSLSCSSLSDPFGSVSLTCEVVKEMKKKSYIENLTVELRWAPGKAHEQRIKSMANRFAIKM